MKTVFRYLFLGLIILTGIAIVSYFNSKREVRVDVSDYKFDLEDVPQDKWPEVCKRGLSCVEKEPVYGGKG